MTERRWEVPKSWVWTPIGEIADVVGGGTPNANNPANFASEGIPWVTPADLTGYRDAHISRGARNLSEAGYKNCSAKLMPAGTVLFSSRAPIGYCVIARNEISTNQGFKSFVLSRSISPEFVRHYLIASVDYAKSKASGTTFQELSGSRAAELMVPVAPSREQQRIAAKIDSLSAKSKRARDQLDHVPRLVEKYKQAILAAAFRGDLTRDWRGANGDKSDWTTSTIGDVATIASGQTPKSIEAALSSDGEIPWFKVSSMNETGNLNGLRSSQFRLPRSKADALGLRICRPGSIAFPKRGGAIATNKKRRLLVEGALDLNLMVLTARMVIFSGGGCRT